MLDLWQRDDGRPAATGPPARRELLASTELVTSAGTSDFAASLTGRGEVPEPLPHDKLADGRLVDAVRQDLRGEDGQASATAVRMIWTGDHLDAARRLQKARSSARPERSPRVRSALLPSRALPSRA